MTSAGTPAKVGSCGSRSSSTMMVMMMAMTPSVKAFRRSGFIAFPLASPRFLGHEAIGRKAWVHAETRRRGEASSSSRKREQNFFHAKARRREEERELARGRRGRRNRAADRPLKKLRDFAPLREIPFLLRAPAARRLASPRDSIFAVVWIDRGLRLHPFDQLVELDRLLGRGQRVGGRKSVFAGGLSSAAGGSG